MPDSYNSEPMLDMFIFETSQLLEQLEQILIGVEKSNCCSRALINEVFRIMHTIKGSSAMMLFNNISTLSHSAEDLFYFLREDEPQDVDFSVISELMLECVDFVKIEMEKIKNGDPVDGSASLLTEKIKKLLVDLKQNNTPSEDSRPEPPAAKGIQKYYISPNKVQNSPKNIFKTVIFFEEGCEMENIRAYTIINYLKDISEEVCYIPEDVIENDDSVQTIRRNGFNIFFKSDRIYDDVYELLIKTPFIRQLELKQLNDDEEFKQFSKKKEIVIEEVPIVIPRFQNKAETLKADEKEAQTSSHQSIINVNVSKLDKLLDLVGELVISEAMVTQNSDLNGMVLDNFRKSARQHRKIIGEVQDMVMSIRMVPISNTFHKMSRIVHDMSKKLGKDVELEIAGEETEVDKNIIEHVSDPLMHLIRNAIDHGIETAAERLAKGKVEPAKVKLEAGNAGSEVWITVSDNGRGLNKEKIIKKALEGGLLQKPPSEMTDKEAYSLIFIPGFSTKDVITEFSGRGVGMDVVTRNIEAIGGSASVDSTPGEGTSITLKIPLTLAIIDGMNISVGNSMYTIPITSVREAFKVKRENIITDPDGNEMIMVRGQCYSILRLHELFKTKTNTVKIPDGIILMVENKSGTLCIFADELLGQQQVVVKALPGYIRKMRTIKGLAGCTLLGDGSISLILDVEGL